MPAEPQSNEITSQVRTPENRPPDSTDRIMLLSQWRNMLQNPPYSRTIFDAGMGKPSFPINPALLTAIIEELQRVRDLAIKARAYLDEESTSDEHKRITVGKLNAVIGYEDPQGILSARVQAAKALSTWYGVDITEKHILFTTGGAGGIFDVSMMLHQKNPSGYIITPFPFYSLYASINYRMNNLHPIHVMREQGYKLTASALMQSISEANKAGRTINAFLFCDPNNPLGTVVSKEEWIKIAAVLKSVPHVPVIIDGAYAEMVFDPQKKTSLLEVADAELKKRIILLRSGTKALSAAGLRMAITIAFDPDIMTSLQLTNIDIGGHAVTIIQNAFATMLHHLNEPKEIKNFVSYYQPQVELAYKQLNEMGAGMPDPTYKPEATFYVVGDFSDLLGVKLFEEAYVAIGKKENIATDEDVCYDLLFRNGVMIAPMSYYGINETEHAYMRITCSGGDKVIDELMLILAERLFSARIEKIETLSKEIKHLLLQLEKTNAPPNTLASSQQQLEQLLETSYFLLNKNSAALKAKQVLTHVKEIQNNLNKLFLEYHSDINQVRSHSDNKPEHIPDFKSKNYAHVLPRLIAHHLLHKQTQRRLNDEWHRFVEAHYQRPSKRARLYDMTPAERMDPEDPNTPRWEQHLYHVPNPLVSTTTSPR